MDEDGRRRLVWPLLLILAGVLLLLDQLGVLAFTWRSLWRLWPVVLVLVGLDILLSHTRRGALLFLLAGTAVIALALALLPEMRTSRTPATAQLYSYPAAGIESAEVSIEVGVGELAISALPDSANLYEARVWYDKAHTQVIAEVEREGDVAEVRLTSKHDRWTPVGATPVDRWEVRLSTGLPISLRVNGGINRTRLDLRALLLEELDLNLGVGEVEVLLPSRGPYTASIDGGVGALKLELPADARARLRVEEGLGAVHVDSRFQPSGRYYVTEGYEPAEDAIEVDIKGGVGSVTVR